MQFLGDMLKSAVGAPTSEEVKRAHNALVESTENKISACNNARIWSVALTALGLAGYALEASSGSSRSFFTAVAIVGGLACTFITTLASHRLQEQLTVIKSNANYVHPKSGLGGREVRL